MDSAVDRTGLAESTLNACFKIVCKCIMEQFSSEYLRLPTLNEIRQIEARYCCLGFPGAKVGVDCANIDWAMCPIADHGRYIGTDKKPALRMEVYSDDTLRIWSCEFGFPAAINAINIMQLSPFFYKIRTGMCPCPYPKAYVADMHVAWYHFLVDGIYPRFRIFVSSFS